MPSAIRYLLYTLGFLMLIGLLGTQITTGQPSSVYINRDSSFTCLGPNPVSPGETALMVITVMNREPHQQSVVINVSSISADVYPSGEQFAAIPPAEEKFFVKLDGRLQLSYYLRSLQKGDSNILIRLFSQGSQIDFLTETLKVRDSYDLHINVKSWLLGLPLHRRVQVRNYGCGTTGYIRAVANEVNPGEYMVRLPSSNYGVEVLWSEEEEAGGEYKTSRLINLNQDLFLTETSMFYWDTLLLLLPIPIAIIAHQFRIKLNTRYEIFIDSKRKSLALELFINLIMNVIVTIITTVLLRYVGFL